MAQTGDNRKSHLSASDTSTLALNDDDIARRAEERIEQYGGDDPREPSEKTADGLSRSHTCTTTHEHPNEHREEHEKSAGGRESEERDPANKVGWDGPDDPENPQNWSLTKKWSATIICLFMTVNV